jgi:conserved oligomeric Golgi complex subunit 4
MMMMMATRTSRGVGFSRQSMDDKVDEVDPSSSNNSNMVDVVDPNTAAPAATIEKLPASMAEALDWPDPEAALRALSAASAVQARALSKKLLADLETTNSISSSRNDDSSQNKNVLFSKINTQLPDLLYLDRPMNNNNNNNNKNSSKDHCVHNAMACADSILQSLTKIAVGGSQASAEIRKLEEEKLALDCEAQAIEQAILLRQASNRAAMALQEEQNKQVRQNSINSSNSNDSNHSGNAQQQQSNTTGTAPNYAAAADALAIWLEWKDKTTATSTTSMQDVEISHRARLYAGEYSLEQLQRTYRVCKTRLLEQFEAAVQTGNLGMVGQLTPVLSKMQLEDKAVALYMQFLKSVLETSLAQATLATGNNDKPSSSSSTASSPPPPPPYVAMGRSYNAAVTVLRHHLPLVSHCLQKAHGDVAVVQLVHTSCANTVVPLWQTYQRDRQLVLVSNHAARIARILEERYYSGHHHASHTSTQSHLASTSRRLLGDTTDALLGAASSSSNDEDAAYYEDDDAEDAGFATQIGSLSDVDAAMEEVALCLQHAESYLRFIQHTCHEVNKARQIRYEHAAQQMRLERERAEWAAGTTGKRSSSSDANGENYDNNNYNNSDEDKPYQAIEILPPSTRLHQTVAEVGGQYVSIERCLLLASMQRAFVASPDADARYYRPLSSLNKSGGGTAGGGSASGGGMGGSGSEALQTALVDTCLYAARRSTQRAFATGHTGTASAMTNFCVDALSAVLLEVLRQRAEDSGVAMLKPGEGLLISAFGGGGLAGSAIFNSAASHLIRQGAGNVGVGVSNVMSGGTTPQQKLGGSNTVKDELARKQKVAHACAVMNDLEVAVFHTEQLENVLTESITKGFPPGTHDTEQLLMCVKSLSTVTESMRLASDATIESLDSVLKPRIRSIVGEAVGSEGSSSSAASASAFMVSPMGGGKASDRNAHVRTNYNLDEEAYNMLQLSEGYINRLCTLLDELMDPLRVHLAPRLWDVLWLSAIGTAAKRLETLLLRKCSFTALGALALDSDMRDWVTYTRERLSSQSAECAVSNLAVMRACPPLGRLVQIAKLLNVDDLEDVLDFISAMKRKGHDWDLKLEDAKAFLSQRVEFDSDKIHELLQIPEGD